MGIFLSALAMTVQPVFAADGDGFVPMFNGKDLSGWVNVNCHPGTFFVKGDEVITTGKPTGYLRTAKQYENFVLEVDWMHVNTKEVGNSGIFVWGDPLPAVGTGYTRGIEVQVLVNLTYKDKAGNVTATSQGDLFSIWGAHCTPDRPHPSGWERCLPSENRTKGGGEWNHYKVTANDGVIKLEVNGKEVSGVSKCNPRKGYLALESEGAECHFKNLKIKELPSTNPKPEECAKVDEGFVSLFNGLDLAGWKSTDEKSWKVNDGVAKATAKAELVTEKKFGPFELLFDCKLPAKSTAHWSVEVGANRSFEIVSPEIDDRGKWNRVVISVGKDGVSHTVNGKVKAKSDFVPGAGPIMITPVAGLELRSLFIREIKEK
jgi:hypothetical protein